MTITRRAALGASLGLLAAPRLARAAWPERAVTIVVPFAAGGGTDISARVMAQYLERELGQPFVVQNRGGAGGAIGLSAVANSAPDGYTIGIINTPGIVTIPIERSPGWNMDSFTFIAGVVEDPATLSVHPDSPIRSIADLVETAKREPGRVTVSTQGVGSAGHISTLLLEQAAGISFEPVAYAGAAPAALALMRKEITVATANLGEALTFARAQPWRTLGVMSESRHPMAPDVPTLKESGYDLRGGSLRGVGGPKGMPADVVARLSAAVARVVANPEFQATSERAFQPLRYLNSADYVAYLKAADETHRRLWAVRPWNR
ncbi:MULTISPECIES: tripartite tricarboxylate transporter substrate binding protein [Roseomonadaceae]|uniref:Tripartite tricarboxylate transporter substrate binding protein n=1 Tax=Falsiroseomonas oleicola TaxID=2801474 RepID=A0ABS6HBT8_9PROT|nr:tripartite tricarboxylate transporter substrate binding protein [Roseomonas oleicola]MBU8545398.1 tripartite tricarboxylate transporter substrate binding protein [Roseomonas oleicola]